MEEAQADPAPPQPPPKRGRKDNNYDPHEVAAKRRSCGMRRVDGLMSKAWEVGRMFGFHVLVLVETDHGRVVAYANEGGLRPLLSDERFVAEALDKRPAPLDKRPFAEELERARSAGYAVPPALSASAGCNVKYVPLVKTKAKRRPDKKKAAAPDAAIVDRRPRDEPELADGVEDYYLDVAMPGARRDSSAGGQRRALTLSSASVAAAEVERASIASAWLAAAEPVRQRAALDRLVDLSALRLHYFLRRETLESPIQPGAR